ncbi:MAG: hypothetical protein ABIG28_00980 [archaeon]
MTEQVAQPNKFLRATSYLLVKIGDVAQAVIEGMFLPASHGRSYDCALSIEATSMDYNEALGMSDVANQLVDRDCPRLFSSKRTNLLPLRAAGLKGFIEQTPINEADRARGIVDAVGLLKKENPVRTWWYGWEKSPLHQNALRGRVIE